MTATYLHDGEHIMMFAAIASIFILILSGTGAVAAGRRKRSASTWAGAGLLLAAIFGLPPALQVLFTGKSLILDLPWQMPGGSLALALDPLSAFFILPVLILGAVFALYGREYMAHYEDMGRRHGLHWFFYNLLAAGMIGVLMARNGLLFLLAWEVMSLAPFFLILFLDTKDTTRKAAWTYLVAAHLGGLFLLLFFLLLGREFHSLDFSLFHAESLPSTTRNLLFALALIGFGAKAGIIPLHVWLPEAHPAAPSHVSAYMSGVMIKMGIYGLMRTMLLLGAPSMIWAEVLVISGIAAGILGVLFAIAQHDLKRLLAYHSVENIGIILLGFGIGLVGVNRHAPLLACLGLGGALLHVLNHSIFKGLLFLGAGSVQHACHTLEIDELGGLNKRMPWTTVCFITGATAICGLPPLNGFVSEFLIYAGAFNGNINLAMLTAWPLIAALAALALIGGLAAACFAKVCGIVFLGRGRSRPAREANEAGLPMRSAMAILSAACLAIGLGAPLMVHLIQAPLILLVPGMNLTPALNTITMLLTGTAMFSTALLICAGIIFLGRSALLSRRKVTTAATWDCGYLFPSERMQYTASSFAAPITDFFAPVLRSRVQAEHPEGEFARRISWTSWTPDLFNRTIFIPLFSATSRLLGLFRWMQHGRVQLYILNIVITLLLLIAAMAGGLL